MYICKMVPVFIESDIYKLNVRTVLINSIFDCFKFTSLLRIVNYPILQIVPLKDKCEKTLK